MAKRSGRRPSFKDIVESVEVRPTPEAAPVPGLHGNVLIDAALRRYELVRDDLSAEEAHALAQSGARLVWDSCGCGGYCEVKWFSAEEVRSMASTGPPKLHRKKRHEAIAEMRADDGSCVILVNGDPKWGNALG